MPSSVFRFGVPALLSFLPIAIGLGLSILAVRRRYLVPSRAFGLFAAAAVLGGLCAWASAAVRGRLGLDPRLVEVAPTLLGFHILLEAPVIETAKAIVVWRAYRRGLLSSVRVGAIHGALVGAGFAFGELGRELWRASHSLPMSEARLALAVFGHVSFAMCWAALLRRSGRDRFFGVVWLGLAAGHGFFRDVVFERPAGQLSLTLPLVPLMALLGWLLIFRSAARPLLSERFETEGSQALFDALMPKRSRASFLWIVFGSLVTLGVTLTFLAASVFLGNRLGADFSLLDEGSLTRAEPLLLLGAALLAAFPFSAFLVARASAARSVVEPAWSTAAAVILVLVFFSVTEPGAVIVALALAPVAFVLGCLGAWAGVDSHSAE
jgi:hypothetical protein